MEMKKRLVDANVVYEMGHRTPFHISIADLCDLKELLEDVPTVDAVEVVHGRWELTAHEEYSNYRWNVTAECSECHHSKGEVYAGFFPGFPQELARMTVLDCAKSVKLDNYCPNCGAKMDGGNED